MIRFLLPLALLVLGVACSLAETVGDEAAVGVPHAIPIIEFENTTSEQISGSTIVADLGPSASVIQDQIDRVLGADTVPLAGLAATGGQRIFTRQVHEDQAGVFTGDEVNAQRVLADFTLPDGTQIHINYGSWGEFGSLAAGGCVDCTINDMGGGFLIEVVRPDGSRESVLMAFDAGGVPRFIDVGVERALTQTGDALIDGPDAVDEDAPATWTAVTGAIQLPEGASDPRPSFAWQASNGDTGDEESFTTRFQDPGPESVTLVLSMAYSLSVPNATCVDLDAGCDVVDELEEQPPQEFSQTLEVTVRDGTPPDLTVDLGGARVEVTEDPRDGPPPKQAAVTTSGRFEGTTAGRQPYDAIQVATHSIDENQALPIQLTAQDNSGSATTSWELQIRGATTGTITQAGGAVDELEANYPIGSVRYLLVARAVDDAGNETVVRIPIQVVDVSLAEVPVTLDHPALDEDTFYEFVVASPLLEGPPGAPVPDSIPAVAEGFVGPTWAGDPQVREASLDGLSLDLALAGALDGVAEVASVTPDPLAGVVRIRMRLLQPRPIELAIHLERKFDYQQEVGSGSITKTEVYLRAQGRFTLDPADITPPRLELHDLRTAHPAFPRAGGVSLVLDEEPPHCEPAPVKRARLVADPSPGFHPQLEEPRGGSFGPFAMARSGGAMGWTAHVSSLRPPLAAGPGVAAVALDAFFLEDTPLVMEEGREVVAVDNGPGPVTVQLEVLGPAGFDLAAARAAGFPTPTYVRRREADEGLEVAAALAPEAPAYRVRVTATDAAGNRSRVELPAAVLDLTPPELQLELRSQDANELKVWTFEAPPDADPGAKRAGFLLAGPYLTPGQQRGVEFELDGKLGYDVEFPLPWTFGLYHGSADGDLRNTEPGFGPGLPEALQGAYIPANHRVYGRVQHGDNHPSARTAEWLAAAGVTWDLQDGGGASVSGENPEYLMVRAPNFPPERYPDAPSYFFLVAGEDIQGNRIQLRIPVFFFGKDFDVRQLAFEGGRK